MCITVKSQIIEPCAMKSEIPFSGMEAKNTAKTQQKHSPFPPAETEKKKYFLDLTERGKSDDIAQGSIIRDFTVL